MRDTTAPGAVGSTGQDARSVPFRRLSLCFRLPPTAVRATGSRSRPSRCRPRPRSTWATTPAAGAVVTFLGVVRDHAEGRDGVQAMTYEAYEDAGVSGDGRDRERGTRALARRRTHRVAAPSRRAATVGDVGGGRRVVAAPVGGVRGGARSASTPSRRPCRSGSRSTGRAARTGPSNSTRSVGSSPA